MYRTIIAATPDGIKICREYASNPEIVPYHFSDEADFPDEKAFRILAASKLDASLTPEGGVEFRQESE